MNWRFVVFLAAIAVAIGSYVAYDVFHVPQRSYPSENLIFDTSYGPVLFLNIPVSLGWAFLAVERRWVRVLGVCFASLLLLIFLIEIAAMRQTFVAVH